MAASEPRGSGPKLIALLKQIAEVGHAVALKDIAEKADLPPSTAHRLMTILVQTGVVERGAHQTYRPGRELYRIASLLRSQFDLADVARPYLERLWSDWQETIVLCLFNPSTLTATIVDAVITPHPLRYAVDIGLELSLPWGSLGCSMLACLETAQVDEVLGRATVGPLSGRPVPSRKELAADLDRIREQGFADYSDPEHDVAGVAAPLTGSEGRLVGCIGITMPVRRFQAHEGAGMGEAVRTATQELSTLLEMQG